MIEKKSSNRLIIQYLSHHNPKYMDAPLSIVKKGKFENQLQAI